MLTFSYAHRLFLICHTWDCLRKCAYLAMIWNIHIRCVRYRRRCRCHPVLILTHILGVTVVQEVPDAAAMAVMLLVLAFILFSSRTLAMVLYIQQSTGFVESLNRKIFFEISYNSGNFQDGLSRAGGCFGT